MCGIAGTWGKDALGRTTRMLPLMLHRGPDGEGVWEHDNLVLGHRRLAINDLSAAGKQPMLSRDNSVAISVNGEIYNYNELRSELETEGYQFVSKSDSEVVIHAWKAWGEGCFERFNGMFAIALYDANTDQLILARDRLGIKPLYYSYLPGEDLAFASEIKALKAGLIDDKISIDPVGLAQYLTYQNYFGSRTLHDGISMLLPGHLLILQRGIANIKPYWELSFSADSSVSFDEAVDQYSTAFSESVSRHLMSDVPVASYLSAGFDSASVANRASLLGEPPVSFTGTFSEGGWYDETSMAGVLASDNGSQHVPVLIGPEDVPRVFDKLIYALDEPRMGMGALPQYCIAEKVAETHKVVLTGHGGDELFSGYPVFKLVNLLNQFSISPLRGLRELVNIRISELPHIVYFLLAKLRSRRYKQFFPVLNSAKSLREGLKPEFSSVFESIEPDDQLIAMEPKMSNSEEVLYTHYLQAYMSGLLVVEDKLSMAHSLESRTPMLDNVMLDFSLKIPQSVKMQSGQLKAIIKEGGRHWLNPALYKQPKRGFPTPLRFWLRGPLKDWFSERLIGSNSALKQIFNEDWLQKQHDSYLYSVKRKIRPLDEIQSHRMWQLLSLESWIRQSEIGTE